MAGFASRPPVVLRFAGNDVDAAVVPVVAGRSVSAVDETEWEAELELSSRIADSFQSYQ